MRKMNEKKMTMLLLTIMSLLLLLSAGLVSVAAFSRGNEKEAEVSYRSFGDWTEYEIFDDVPAITGDGIKIGKVTDNNFNNYTIEVDYTSKENYQDYLVLLEDAGFKKHVDNGKEGFDDSVFNVTYIKDNLVVTIIHIDTIDKTYVSAQYDQALSEHLFYSEDYVRDNIEGAKTNLAMLELYSYGNSLVYQLKNGHFIVSDGGRSADLPYLLDYLESKAPEGEKPIVEAWFFTHAHFDHVGIMTAFYENAKQAERIYVEGIYYNMVSSSTLAEKDSTNTEVAWSVKYGSMVLKTTEGTAPKIYRTTTGQRYYFNDITIDILMSQEQVSIENYVTDLNESSTWCMVTADGQKILMTGDAGRGSMSCVMRSYSGEYLKSDIMTSMHHSNDTWDVFTNYCGIEVFLVTKDAIVKNDANTYLTSRVKETLTFGEGGVVLTLPYEVGTSELLPMIERE